MNDASSPHTDTYPDTGEVAASYIRGPRGGRLGEVGRCLRRRSGRGSPRLAGFRVSRITAPLPPLFSCVPQLEAARAIGPHERRRLRGEIIAPHRPITALAGHG
ncbi:hypothetical protein NL676_017299 [Syzygium grande]|nr:hypothetical protein NL676_017299 [Syzygium grande]